MIESEVKKQTLAIIDGNSIVHRAYHALPPFTTKDGILVNAVYGFFSFLFKVIKELAPEAIAVTFDLAAPTFRHYQFDGYKAKRKKAPDDLYYQIPKIKDILNAFNIKFFTQEGFEADDLIGTIASLANNNPDFKVVIISSDTDVLQLVSKDTNAMILQRGISQAIIYKEKDVLEKYQGLTPKQLIDFKALRGDPTDNIPGVFGIGEKTAIDLIGKFNSLENLYSVLDKEETKKIVKQSVLDKLISQKDQAFMSRNLAEIHTNIEIDFDLNLCFWKDYDYKEVEKLFKDLGFFSLASKLPRI
ncbi:MAG: hypothetical protein COU70_01320 [Parcubacteria group bacterium CG10_big_fil_rev_8_21_14_0_10_35_15]|nr:MAG: hypothetical protein COU70_01320 [Parcubacteria group bacterium CG10_big_fil_rev_8_21_14_0_10_35_15]